MKIKFVEKRIEQIKSIKTTVGLDEVKVQAKIEEAMVFRPTKSYGTKDGTEKIDLVIFQENEIITFSNWYLLAIYMELTDYRKYEGEERDKRLWFIYAMYMEDSLGYGITDMINFMDDKELDDPYEKLNEFYKYKEEEYL